MHPFLLPGEWLVKGRFFDPDGGETVTTGAAVIKTTEQFPEILQVAVELREIGGRTPSQPQSTFYHLEIVGTSRVKFRMDSIALGTILVGEGSFTSQSLILSYLSPDRRYVGFESFTVQSSSDVLACGSFIADGAPVKTWEVGLESVPLRERSE